MQFALFISKQVSPWCPAFDWLSGLYGGNEVWSNPYGLSAEEDNPRQRSYPDPQLYVLPNHFGNSLVKSMFSGAENTFHVRRLEKLSDLLMRKLTWVWSTAAQTLLSKAVYLCTRFFSVWPSWTGPPPISVLLVFAQQAGWLLACGPLLPPLRPRPGPSSHCWRKTRPKCQSVSAVFRSCEWFVNGNFARKLITSWDSNRKRKQIHESWSQAWFRTNI